jgi:hypothetical protein
VNTDKSRLVSVLERTIAAAACIATGSWYSIGQGITVGIVAAIVLLPLWIGLLWRMRSGPLMIVLGMLAIVSGYVLTVIMSATHKINDGVEAQNLFFIVALVGGIGALVWARSIFGDGWTALWFGVGLCVAVATRGIEADNPWKFSLSVPVIVVLLAVCLLVGSRVLTMTTIVGLALVSALNDSRSSTSVLLVAAGLLAWEYILPRDRTKASVWRTIGAFAVIAFAAYNALQTFILEGWLGTAAQERSEAQIALSGSLIAGGRPEMGATFALLNFNPWGFGAGTVPTFQDILIAKTGMRSLNYEPNNGYVENYMFGGGFEVHSLVGDFWLRFGIPGLVLILTLLVTVIIGAARSVSQRRGYGLQLVLGVQVAWDCMFAPLYSVTLSTLTLAVARAHKPRTRATRGQAAYSYPARTHSLSKDT